MITGETSTPSNIVLKEQPHRGRKWSWWLVPEPFDLVSSLLYIGTLIPYLYSFATRSGYASPVSWWQAICMIVVTIALLTVDRVEYFLYGEETPIRVAVFFLVARIVLIEVLCWLDQFKNSPFLYLVLPFLACLYFGDKVGYCVSVLVWIVYILKHMYYAPGWFNNGTELHYLTLFTIGNALVITIARVFAKEKASRTQAEELFADLEISHRQLKEYAEQVAELATTRERNRLARDIHDTLGHYLTVINVQLEKALVFHDKKPQETTQAISDAKRLASEALRDVRRSVSALRTNQDLPEFIPALTELIEHIQGEHCRLELQIEGNEKKCSKQNLLTLYRAVQEGLTNIQKHANANHIWIDLHFEEQETILVLRDNGCGFEMVEWQRGKPERGGGYGLQGVQERLELVSGSLAIESAPGQGTILRITIPGNG